MTAVLGLDVGGTHSRARLVRDGAVVADANGPSASLAAARRDRAGAAVRSLLGELALGPGAGLDAVCVGTAGTGAAESDAFFVELLSPSPGKDESLSSMTRGSCWQPTASPRGSRA